MFESTETTQKLYVKLRSNPFDTESYIGSVPRNTVSMDALITAIAKNNTGIDKYAIYHSAELLKEEIKKQLASGRAVNVLELGTVYIGVTGKINSSNPADISKFTVKFTPSQSIQSSISSVSADGIMYADATPVIDFITGQTDGNTGDALVKEDFVELSGTKLKVGGADSGIFFAPESSGGSYNTDETSWIAADLTTLRQNTDKTLRFKLPAALANGVSYFIIVRTSLTRNNTTKKTVSTGISAVTVKLA